MNVTIYKKGFGIFGKQMYEYKNDLEEDKDTTKKYLRTEVGE